MAAMVLSGRKREASDHLDESCLPSKRFRCAASSLGGLPSAATFASHEGKVETPLHCLRMLFPDLDPRLIERVLEALGNNFDNAIKSLKDIQSGYVEREPESPAKETTAEHLVIENLPTDGSGWVELFVREMMGASGIDHARARAARVLELLEKSIITRAGAKEAQSFHEENKMLKERLEAVLHDNSILKRGIAILHERQKDYDAKSQEVEQLKQTLSQYREQVKTLEINNYALTMHLKQAQQNSSISERFHPDIF